MIVYRKWEKRYKRYSWSNHQTWSAIKALFKYTSDWNWDEKQCEGWFLFGFIPLFVKEIED